MINPSANGWIDKFFSTEKPLLFPVEDNLLSFYQKLRETGFIYGHIVSINTSSNFKIEGWTENEISKVALLNHLFSIYSLTTKEDSQKVFVDKAITFYDEMNPQKFNFFKNVLLSSNSSSNLEKIIDNRVQTNIDIINKNFSPILTNALLFIDVLAFQQYLIHGKIPEKYLIKIEEVIINIVSLALNTKLNKTNYDDLLVKLFESSVRYSKFSKGNSNKGNLGIEQLGLELFTNELEKYYFIDMAGLALWSDGIIEKNEAFFLYKLAQFMGVSEEFVNASIIKNDAFISKNKNKISYFNYSNPVKHFYDHITQTVTKLISRNKNRLVKEITQSKELMRLLADSTKRDLNEKEKKKVKKQLLDICKSVPSLTIFLLPGGSLLLPILVKFIPTLLPSAFNENLESED